MAPALFLAAIGRAPLGRVMGDARSKVTRLASQCSRQM